VLRFHKHFLKKNMLFCKNFEQRTIDSAVSICNLGLQAYRLLNFKKEMHVTSAPVLEKIK